MTIEPARVLTVREVRGLLFGLDNGSNTIGQGLVELWKRRPRTAEVMADIRTLEMIDENLLIVDVRKELFDYDNQDVEFTGLRSFR